jgi:hypothetical protein
MTLNKTCTLKDQSLLKYLLGNGVARLCFIVLFKRHVFHPTTHPPRPPKGKREKREENVTELLEETAKYGQ